jgi:beta-glucosidase
VKPFSVKEVAVLLADKVLKDRKERENISSLYGSDASVEERVESLLSVMTRKTRWN